MRKLSRRRSVLVGAIAVAGLILLVAYFFHTINAPTSGSIAQSGQLKPSPPQPKTALFNGNSVSFSYSTNYSTRALTKSSGYQDAVLLLGKKSNDQIAVAVVRGDIANEYGVSYRRQNPDRYHETAIPNGLVFTSTSPGFERTVYISHAGLEISISAVSLAGKDLTTDSQQIVQSLVWKQ